MVRVPLGVRQMSLRGTQKISKKIKIFYKFMDFMSIFLSSTILRPKFAYFSVHFYDFMPSDVVLPSDFSVQERDQLVELGPYQVKVD